MRGTPVAYMIDDSKAIIDTFSVRPLGVPGDIMGLSFHELDQELSKTWQLRMSASGINAPTNSKLDFI